MAEYLDPSIRLIAPDMRGHGESEWVGAGGYYHFYDYYHDVRTIFSALGAPNIYLVGHSMGGSIATGMAAMLGEQVLGLLLLEGTGPSETPLEATTGRLLRWSKSLQHAELNGDVQVRRQSRTIMPDLDAAVMRLCRWNARLTESSARMLAASMVEPADNQPGLVWRYDPLHRTPAAKPFLLEESKSIWGDITAPTIALYGAHGIRAERMNERYQAFRSLTVGTILEAGHNLHHEHPDLLANVVEDMMSTGRLTKSPKIQLRNA